MVARHIKRGFKKFGKKSFLSELWSYAKIVGSMSHQMSIASRNFVDNMDGTFSMKRPHSYKEK